MLPKVLSLYKPAGLTPLQTLDRLRERFPDYEAEKLSYAGRLDPMAEGVMLVLVGDGNYEREQYLDLPKTYEAQILFGVSTDTGDALGLITDSVSELSPPDEVRLQEVLKSFVGTIMQEYPQFSSPKIAGKVPPVKTVTIGNIDMLGLTIASREFLQADILRRVAVIEGDFRQAAIIDQWNEYLISAPAEFPMMSLRVEGSSGLYIRVLAERIGAELGLPALAYTIGRTKVGDYGTDGALRVD